MILVPVGSGNLRLEPASHPMGQTVRRDLHSPGSLQSRCPSLRSGVTGFLLGKKNGVKNWGRGENVRHAAQAPAPFCLKDRATEAQRGA